MAEQRGRELVFRNDPVGEQQVLAAALASPEYLRELADRHAPDVFLVEEHRRIWACMREAVKRQLAADPATVSRLSGGEVDGAYLAELMRARPDPPDRRTLDFWVEQLLWDRQRYVALTGPISGLLESIEKGEEPARVRGLARSVSASFDGWADRAYLLDSDQLIAEQMVDLRKRREGRSIYPFGIPGLDYFENQEWRMVPGTAPGMVTVVTGVPGAGKSTVTAHIVKGVARQRRRVLYGAWEMRGGVTLELIASLSLCETDPEWRVTRTDLQRGRFTDADEAKLEERMRQLSKYVRFLANPFRRHAGDKRRSNEHNLDLVHGYIADSGCSLFVADLWKRCLVSASPEDEEEALYRQQAMAEELDVHCVLVQQQRLKDIEARPDKRPTREGIKGSGAWTEVADNILGVHRAAKWKPVTDDVLEIDVLKQRYGRDPLAVEFEWDPERGTIRGGRSIEYDLTASGGRAGNVADQVVVNSGKKWSGKR